MNAPENAHTEAEAAELLCVQMPMSGFRARVGDVEKAKFEPTAAKCHGSKCMAWRWTEPRQAIHVAGPGVVREPLPRPEGVPADWEWIPAFDPAPLKGACRPGHWAQPLSPPKGYCGLAGRPP